MQSGRQFEYEVVQNSELDSNSVIPNWIGSPPSRVSHWLSSTFLMLRLSSMVFSLIPKNN
jgi:hypothetical protein